MSTYEGEIEKANYEIFKSLIKEGVVTDMERLRKVFKLSKKKMDRSDCYGYTKQRLAYFSVMFKLHF